MINPLPCVLLSVDPGRTSGWALWHDGELISSGAVDVGSIEVEDQCANAIALADNHNTIAVLVGETWGRGGPMGLAGWQGLGYAWGRWDDAMKLTWAEHVAQYGKTGLKPRSVRIHVSTWRSKIFGCRVPKDKGKTMAVEEAIRLHGLNLTYKDHDQAEAVLLGHYACRSTQVRDRLPKTALKGYKM